MINIFIISTQQPIFMIMNIYLLIQAKKVTASSQQSKLLSPSPYLGYISLENCWELNEIFAITFVIADWFSTGSILPFSDPCPQILNSFTDTIVLQSRIWLRNFNKMTTFRPKLTMLWPYVNRCNYSDLKMVSPGRALARSCKLCES